MSYEVIRQGRTSIVKLTGDIDMHVSPQARRTLLQCLDGDHDLVVDLAGVSYIDSSGVATLVECYQTARSQQVRFALLGVSQSALNVLKLARLDQVFPIHASLEACLARGG